MDISKDIISEPALLELCAEECNELAHACLKMARKMRDENPTPAKDEYLRMKLIEEIADVRLTVDALVNLLQLPQEQIVETTIVKERRWIKRIDEKNKGDMNNG